MRYAILKYCLAVLFIAFAFALTISAEEKSSFESIPEGYSELIGSLPSEVADKRPEGIYSQDIDELGDVVAQMSTPSYVFSFIASFVKLGIKDAAALLATLLGIIVLSAVFSAFKSSFEVEGISRAVSICSSCALFGCTVFTLSEHFERVGELFNNLALIVNGMIPVMSVIYAMGGNVLTAVSSSTTLYIFIAFCEEICRTSILPVAAVCTAFCLCGAISPDVKLQSISSAIKKGYTFVLGLIMTVLIAVLSGQTVLSSASDGISARAAKLVAANVIPIVGGSIGETLRTVAASVGYIKGVCGIGAIIFIFMLVLPTLITLLLTRAVFIISVSIADVLGCEREGKLLSELSSVYGMTIAVISMCSVMFVLALTIFIRCSVAAG